MGDAPFEHLANSRDVLVHSFTADALINELLPACDQGQRAKLSCELVAIELADGAQRRLETPDLTGRLSVLDVSGSSVFPEGQYQFVDRSASRANRHRRALFGFGERFRDEPAILFLALFGSELT